jgi:hypothetical protein
MVVNKKLGCYNSFIYMFVKYHASISKNSHRFEKLTIISLA